MCWLCWTIMTFCSVPMPEPAQTAETVLEWRRWDDGDQKWVALWSVTERRCIGNYKLPFYSQDVQGFYTQHPGEYYPVFCDGKRDEDGKSPITPPKSIDDVHGRFVKRGP